MRSKQASFLHGGANVVPSAERRTLLRAALSLAAGVGLSSWSNTASANALAVGKPAPELVLHTIDGTSISSKELTGKVVILTFWATWCGPCLTELPLLSEYLTRHRKQGLEILGFSLDGAENLPEVRRFASRLNFPVGLLGSPWGGDYGRMWRIPVSFTIDRNGVLADNGWNEDDPVWTAERLERIVTPLLAK